MREEVVVEQCRSRVFRRIWLTRSDKDTMQEPLQQQHRQGRARLAIFSSFASGKTLMGDVHRIDRSLTWSSAEALLANQRPTNAMRFFDMTGRAATDLPYRAETGAAPQAQLVSAYGVVESRKRICHRRPLYSSAWRTSRMSRRDRSPRDALQACHQRRPSPPTDYPEYSAPHDASLLRRDCAMRRKRR